MFDSKKRLEGKIKFDMKEKLILFFKYVQQLGFSKGFYYFFKIYCLNKKEEFFFIKGKHHPLYLRKNTSDISTFNQIFIYNEYKYSLNFKPAFIIDCGAYIGLSTIFFRDNFPDSIIVAIEPETSNFEVLLKNTQNTQNIYCEKAAIWNKNTNLTIENINNFGNWGFTCNEDYKEAQDKIKAITINDILQKYNQSEIDILKIDIEGAEVEIFSSNFENWLPKTKVIMIELHDRFRKGCSKSFFSALIKYDFSVYCNGENIICVRD